MSKETLHFKFDEKDPDLSVLRDIARGCREGKVLAFPTETVYGIGLPMSIAGGTEKLAEIKNRDSNQPFTLHIGDATMVDLLGVERTPVFKYLTQKFWPGPLTLLVPDSGGKTIGLRYPRNRLITSVINTVGEPFWGTSANKNGQGSPKNADMVLESLQGEIDYLIDGGPCELGEDSTILDLTKEKPEILRRGAQAEEIEKAMAEIESGSYKNKNILVVCTGNSCRSPMAEGWLKAEVARNNLASKIKVSSAGIMAGGGRVATPEAVLAMKNREIDISQHKSHGCTREDVLAADLIIAMSPEHEQFIVGLLPEAKDKIWVLDIPDPIGMGFLIYEEVLNNIEQKLRERWDEIIAL